MEYNFCLEPCHIQLGYRYDYPVDEFGVQKENKEEILWNAEDYDQQNPLYTDKNGMYMWDVPAGQWLVKFSKDGYFDTDSRKDTAADSDGYLPVPPPQTEVNTAIVSKAAPTVENMNAYTDEVQIIFSQYMNIESANTDNVKVFVNGEQISGTISPSDAEFDYKKENQYARIFTFIPNTALSGEVSITVKNVKGANVNPNGALSVNYGDTQEFTITINSGYKLIKVLVNGVDKTSEMIANKLTLTNITSDMTLEVVVEKITYKVVEGAEQKYVITKNTKAKFKIDADYSLFENGGKVYVDGVLLDAKNYKSESGSTIITLNKNYVDTLSNGEHTLKVVFSDGGEATTKFFVENVKTAVENPNTSDNIIIYVVTGILSLLGLTSTMVFVYRRKQTN